jgi:hypothetical protein
MLRHRLILPALMLMAVSVFAHLEEYSPFHPKDKPKRFPVRRLVDWRNENDFNLYLAESATTRGSKNPILRISWPKNDGGVDLTLEGPDGHRLLGPSRISANLLSPYGYAADLNGDGMSDYILMIHTGAVGAIGGGLSDVVFVLSGGGQYRIWMVTSLYPGPHDFLDISGSGRFHFLLTDIVGPVDQIRGKDGRYHNYWVYNLLAVEGPTLKLANSSIAGFPKWVMWTFRPNHDETDQLTAEEKLRLYNPEQICIISTPDRPCPNYFKR